MGLWVTIIIIMNHDHDWVGRSCHQIVVAREKAFTRPAVGNCGHSLGIQSFLIIIITATTNIIIFVITIITIAIVSTIITA